MGETAAWVPVQGASGVCTLCEYLHSTGNCISVHVRSVFVEGSLQVQWYATKHVLMYLAGTTNHGMMIKNVRGGENGYTREISGLYGYSYSDWAQENESRRSTSGLAILFWGSLVGWRSSKPK